MICMQWTGQGAVGLAIWVAEVGKQKRHPPHDSGAGVVNSEVDHLVGLNSGHVWRRRGNSGAEVELCTMDSSDNPGELCISQDALMEECLVSDLLQVFLSCRSLASIPFSTDHV